MSNRALENEPELRVTNETRIDTVVGRGTGHAGLRRGAVLLGVASKARHPFRKFKIYIRKMGVSLENFTSLFCLECLLASGFFSLFFTSKRGAASTETSTQFSGTEQRGHPPFFSGEFFGGISGGASGGGVQWKCAPTPLERRSARARELDACAPTSRVRV